MTESDRGERLRRVFAAHHRGDFDYLLAALVDPETRSQAIRFLAKSGDSRASEPLVRMLRVSDPVTRRAASKALGEIGDRNTFEVLREVAEDDPDTAARGWALLSLGRIDIDQARPILVEALSDETWVIRRDAAFAFGETGGPNDISSLRAASHREPWYRRRVFRQAITKLRR